MTLGQRLRGARKRAGLTQKELAQRIDAKHNSVSNWENGLNFPDATTIENICRMLDVTPNYLIIGDDSTHVQPRILDFGNFEEDFLDKYSSLDKSARGAVGALVDYYYGLIAKPVNSVSVVSRENVASAREAATFELISGRVSTQRVAAGAGVYLDEDAFEPIKVRLNDLTRRAAFYVPVQGDSMEPKFRDGDVLIVEQSAVKPGDVGIFTLDGHGYVKVRGKSDLISLNPQYAPIPMNDDIVCNGKVIGVLDPDWLAD